MKTPKTMITSDGFGKLKEDLQELKTTTMKEALSMLSDARDKGDLSENAEYEVAKENLNMISLKIRHLEERIKNCVIVNKGKISTDSVQLFTTVNLFNLKLGKEMILSIVTDDQIDVKNGKISQGSPIAQGLLGKSVGSVAKITEPSGIMELEIRNISVND